MERFGRLDILVNNSGGPPLARAHDATEEQWATAVQRSLLFFARMSREAMPHLKRSGGGRIINILASTVYQPIPNLALSGATRMGVVAFAKSLADEVGRDGILVNNVCPGSILSERMLSNVTARAKELGISRRGGAGRSAPPRPRSAASASRRSWRISSRFSRRRVELHHRHDDARRRRPRAFGDVGYAGDMTTANVNACIVGGGPAGLMLGLLLAKRGAEVLVLEGHENFEREFRGEVLQPSTAHLLDELGLLEYMLAQPHSLLEAGKVRLNGREVGELSFKRISPEYPYAIWMPQPMFLAALLRKAEPFPSFQCWMGAKVTKLIEEDGRIVGVSGLRHGKEPFEVRADVVVGADGRYSAIARLGGFKTEYEHHDFDVIWFTIEQPPGWSSTFYVSLGEGPRA